MFTRTFLLPKYLTGDALTERARQVFKTSTVIECDSFTLEQVGETAHSVEIRVTCANESHLHYTSNSR